MPNLRVLTRFPNLWFRQADRTELPTTQDIQAAVVAMLSSSNPLRTALDLKMDAAAAYTDAEVEEVVAELLANSPKGNELHTVLDVIDTRLDELEGAVGSWLRREEPFDKYSFNRLLPHPPTVHRTLRSTLSCWSVCQQGVRHT